MSRSIVTYNDFSGGAAGRLAGNSSAKAPRNSIVDGLNMFVTADGLLAVRPGLQDITPSGTANGLVQGFGFAPIPLNDLWYIQGTAVRTFSAGGDNLKTSGTALASTPTVPVDWKVDTTSVLFSSAADKIYRLTPQGGATVPTVAALTGSPGARCLEIYGDRIVAGYINGSNEWRIRYSDAGNPNSWPAGNFVDVGDQWGVYGLHSQRQHLAILKQNSIHVLSGSLGSSQTLRKVHNGDGILHPAQAALGMNDQLWFEEWAAPYPSRFNGATVTQLTHLTPFSDVPGSGGAIPPSHGMVTLKWLPGGGVFYLEGYSAALYLHGVWTFHDFSSMDGSLSGYVSTNGRQIYLCDGGGASASPNFYLWDISDDMPGDGTTAGDAGASGPVEGEFEFPEWWSEDGSEVVVRAVVVDFIDFDNDTETPAGFDLQVHALRGYQAGAIQASAQVAYSESESFGRKRRVFAFGEQGMGGGFKLAFSSCISVAFVTVQVILDSQPVRV